MTKNGLLIYGLAVAIANGTSHAGEARRQANVYAVERQVVEICVSKENILLREVLHCATIPAGIDKSESTKHFVAVWSRSLELIDGGAAAPIFSSGMVTASSTIGKAHAVMEDFGGHRSVEVQVSFEGLPPPRFDVSITYERGDLKISEGSIFRYHAWANGIRARVVGMDIRYEPTIIRFDERSGDRRSIVSVEKGVERIVGDDGMLVEHGSDVEFAIR